ncbi:MAG: hypothetical protein O7G84_01125 [Gammaproteobacteria bacterium]|nr:hypothetical protein [Gammaproteobacteria bacterium]
MTTQLEQLVDQGHTMEEAELVVRLTATAFADRAAAVRTGMCACGARMARVGHGRIECLSCDAVHAA